MAPRWVRTAVVAGLASFTVTLWGCGNEPAGAPAPAQAGGGNATVPAPAQAAAKEAEPPAAEARAEGVPEEGQKITPKILNPDEPLPTYAPGTTTRVELAREEKPVQRHTVTTTVAPTTTVHVRPHTTTKAARHPRHTVTTTTEAPVPTTTQEVRWEVPEEKPAEEPQPPAPVAPEAPPAPRPRAPIEPGEDANIAVTDECASEHFMAFSSPAACKASLTRINCPKSQPQPLNFDFDGSAVLKEDVDDARLSITAKIGPVRVFTKEVSACGQQDIALPAGIGGIRLKLLDCPAKSGSDIAITGSVITNRALPRGLPLTIDISAKDGNDQKLVDVAVDVSRPLW